MLWSVQNHQKNKISTTADLTITAFFSYTLQASVQIFKSITAFTERHAEHGWAEKEVLEGFSAKQTSP